jgi:hypothetical protein
LADGKVLLLEFSFIVLFIPKLVKAALWVFAPVPPKLIGKAVPEVAALETEEPVKNEAIVKTAKMAKAPNFSNLIFFNFKLVKLLISKFLQKKKTLTAPTNYYSNVKFKYFQIAQEKSLFEYRLFRKPEVMRNNAQPQARTYALC